MKKMIAGLLAGAFLMALLIVTGPRPNPSKFSVGAALPSGKVRPQLVSTWDTGALLAPDGSLWIWGGSQFQLAEFFRRPIVTELPRQIGIERDWSAVAVSFMHLLALRRDGTL